MTTHARVQPSSVTSNHMNTLRNVLRGNVIFSLLSGLLMLLAAGSVANFMDVDATWPFYALGVGLFLWAADVYLVSAQENINPRYVWGIIAGDLSWVIGSALILLFDPFDFSTEGKWAILIIADIVLTFAALQYRSLRRMR